MKVAMVTSWHSQCGIASYSKSLAGSLSKYCQLTILADKALKPELPNNSSLSKVTQMWRYKGLGLDEAFSILREAIRQDLIHWQFEYLLFGLLGLLYFLPIIVILRVVGRVQFVTLHSIVARRNITRELVELSKYRIPLPLLRVSFFVYNFVMGRCCSIIAHNEYGSRVLRTDYYVPTSHVHVIPHGISIETNEIGEEGYLLFQGFIKPVKGLHLLVNAWPSIHRSLPEAKAVIAGKVVDITYFRDIMKSLSQNGVDHVDIRSRFLDELEVENLFAKANVVVAPYNGSVFGSSGVISRAIAHQKPIVYSPIPIFVEELRDLSAHGFAVCVNPTDSAQLAESVVNLWKKNVDRNEYMRITAFRSWESTADKTWKLYDSGR